MNQASTSQRQDRLVWPSRVQLSGSASTISWGQPSSSARSALLMMGVQLAAPPGKCCSWGQQGAGRQAGRWAAPQESVQPPADALLRWSVAEAATVRVVATL